MIDFPFIPVADRAVKRNPACKADSAEMAPQSSFHTSSSLTVDESNRYVQGIITTTTPDLEGEVMLPRFDTSYFPEQVKAVYFDHAWDELPIGKNVNLTQKGNGLYATTYISDTPFANDILTMCREGVINGFSITSFRMDSGAPTPDEVKKYGACKKITRYSKLMEYSVTPMPMNGDAVMKLEGMVAKKSIGGLSAILACPNKSPWHTGQRIDSNVPVVVVDGEAWVLGV